MPKTTFHFPRGFLWGTATSAYQVEGNNSNSQWWAWEQTAGHILNDHKSGLACDWWSGRWQEDFDRAEEGGQNAHRFSVEWSRIQPAPDRWDEEALDRYIEILRGLQERGLTPLVTLHHFSDPIWLTEIGGWENPDAVVYFEKFVRKTVDALKDYVNYWCTINEPNLYAILGYILGVYPPGKKDLRAAIRVFENLVRAHATAYQAIHSLQPAARAGIALNYRSFRPNLSWSPLDHWSAKFLSAFVNDLFPRTLMSGVLSTPLGRKRIPQAIGTQDYFGLNYYTRDQVSFNILKPAEFFFHRFYRSEALLSSTKYMANEPDGIYEGIKWSLQFKIPVLITENGVEDADDKIRPSYLAQHLHQIWRAVNFNFPIKGYFHWTLVDNFEWDRGWTQRFGLWELDPSSQMRRKRLSADLYAEICWENGVSTDMIEQYAPKILSQIFPNIS